MKIVAWLKGDCMDAKYIVMQDPTEQEHIIIFSPMLSHHAVSFSLQEFCPTHSLKPVSAGFVDLKTGKCFGDSTTLKLKSRPEDKYLVSRFLTSM